MRGSDRSGAVESLAGERLGGGSQRLQVPRLQSHKDDKRETVTSIRARAVWGRPKVSAQGNASNTVVLPSPTPIGVADWIEAHKFCFIGVLWWCSQSRANCARNG